MSGEAEVGRSGGGTSGGGRILFPPLPYRMKARITQALGNEQLQQFVGQATDRKTRESDAVLTETFGDRLGPLRELAGRIKQHTLDHLDVYLERFVDAATAAGSHVHFASDAEQANAICVQIARREGCRLCVKSKSMLTEEIRLNGALAQAGVEVVETDLGEFIIQLDGDAPSHIVTPMIHKDRRSVGRVFERKLGAAYSEDPVELCQVARQALRQRFRAADLGVTGGNFLVAQTGSVVVCTNEGNGRMCSSVPRVHVAMVGMEKLVPTYRDLTVLLKLLARSSTAQAMTVYTQVLTGPRRDGERDGPQQMHIVLVDNGRSAILRSEHREVLRCIRCGACLNRCPVYRKLGGHPYGAVYSGPIGAVLTPMLRGLVNYRDLPQASSLCGACYEGCPVRIDLPGHLIWLRKQSVSQGVTGLRERIVFRVWAWSVRWVSTYRLSSWLCRRMLRAMAAVGGNLAKGDRCSARGWIGWRVWPLSRWTAARDLPTPPADSFRKWYAKYRKGSGDE